MSGNWTLVIGYLGDRCRILGPHWYRPALDGQYHAENHRVMENRPPSSEIDPFITVEVENAYKAAWARSPENLDRACD